MLAPRWFPTLGAASRSAAIVARHGTLRGAQSACGRRSPRRASAEIAANRAWVSRQTAGVPQNVFVGDIAKHYDATSESQFAAEVLRPTVDFLADLAGDGRALELAIGTGRVALPLRGRGVDVHGIEISADMIAELRAKPGGADVPVTLGDMAATRLDLSFGLVYLVFNTISNLLTQAEQVACFRNAAAHLDSGGCFVVELGIPQLRRMSPGESAYPFDLTDAHLGFDSYDFATQRMTSHHYWFAADEVRRFDSHHRYAWPAELDLMAELAGMRLRERWADWDRNPFTNESASHISVWEKPAPDDRAARAPGGGTA